MKSFPSSAVQRNFSAVRAAAAKEPVVISANGKETFVLMSLADYRTKIEGEKEPETIDIPELSEPTLPPRPGRKRASP